MSPSQPSFEDDLDKLEAIIESLERGAPTLDESLQQFEAGVKLLRGLQQQLTNAQARIDEVVEIDATGVPRLKPFVHEATAGKKSRKKPALPASTTPPEQNVDPPPTDPPINEDDYLF